MTSNYGNLIYWEERYKNSPGDHFEWLNSYKQIRSVITSVIPNKQASILYIGCGISDLADHLIDDGYTNITCADFSKQALKQQQKRTKHTEIKYKCTDATRMDFKNMQFDAVIDKGMLDAILCSEDYLRKTLRALRQISRVLKQNGVYLMFSHEAPEKRIYYLKNKLTKFKTVDYKPIPKFAATKKQYNQTKLHQNKDQTKSNVSRITKIATEKKNKDNYYYVCTRKEGDINVSRQSQNIQEESREEQDIDEQKQRKVNQNKQKVGNKNLRKQQEQQEEQEQQAQEQQEQQQQEQQKQQEQVPQNQQENQQQNQQENQEENEQMQNEQEQAQEQPQGQPQQQQPQAQDNYEQEFDNQQQQDDNDKQ